MMRQLTPRAIHQAISLTRLMFDGNDGSVEAGPPVVGFSGNRDRVVVAPYDARHRLWYVEDDGPQPANEITGRGLKVLDGVLVAEYDIQTTDGPMKLDVHYKPGAAAQTDLKNSAFLATHEAARRKAGRGYGSVGPREFFPYLDRLLEEDPSLGTPEVKRVLKAERGQF